MEGWGGRNRECMDTVYAWVYSTCHIMVDSTVWFGRRRPMTWMRPGNKSLFCCKISPKSHFIHLQTRWRGWRSARAASMKMHCLHVWCRCGTYNWCSERYITCARNGFQRWNADRWLFLPQRSSSEVIPDIRNGMKIFSPVSGWMMACVQRAWHRPNAVRSPEASACGGVKKPELAFTYLLDLLGFPQLLQGGSKSRRTTVNLNCYLLGAYMQSCDTSTSPMWHQHQYSPDGQRLQEKVYRGCSHQVVRCILSAVSI